VNAGNGLGNILDPYCRNRATSVVKSATLETCGCHMYDDVGGGQMRHRRCEPDPTAFSPNPRDILLRGDLRGLAKTCSSEDKKIQFVQLKVHDIESFSGVETACSYMPDRMPRCQAQSLISKVAS
jgi:hypothetical protein